MKHVAEMLTQKDITLFELKHPSIIQSLTKGNSLGFSSLPPIVANRLNFYAENGSVDFQNREVRFVFITTPIQCGSEKHISTLVESLLWEQTSPLKPLVWVITPRIIISQILGNMQTELVHFYYHTSPGEDVRLYELYKEDNAPRAGIFHEKHLFENLS